MPGKVIRLVRRWLCLPLALAMAAGSAANADPGCESPGRHCCPPCFRWWQEGPPKLHFKCACPRPVCPPCQLEHWGYFETCWRAWPFPPDWSHCPTPPAAAHIEGMLPGMPYAAEPPQSSAPGATPGRAVPPGSELPAPRQVPSTRPGT
jgi:hypothetical protein